MPESHGSAILEDNIREPSDLVFPSNEVKGENKLILTERCYSVSLKLTDAKEDNSADYVAIWLKVAV